MEVMRFNQFNEELNEGWKTNILVGLMSLLGSQAMGYGTDGNKITTKTNLERTAQSYIKQGWKLDSIQIDTLVNKIKAENPDTMVMVTRLKFDKNQYFESGKFQLSQSVIDSIYSSMMEIADQKGVVTNIEITSSTDKQGLSANLANLLKSLGYSPDNKGLSKARANSISEYLKSLGVNETLISTQEMFEQGGEIDQSARFVSLDIYYLIKKYPPEPEDKVVKSVKKTYYLSTDKDVSHGVQKIKGKYKENKFLGPLKNYKNIKAYKCSSFGSRYN